MRTPDRPIDEEERLAALRALHILDTPSEERFDRLTRLAQYILQTPIVLITLVDVDRQWFKSRQGLAVTETPRNISFCAHAIHSSAIFCVPDAWADPRFADNPLVTQPPNIRFYAGAPLTLASGQRVGTLCAIDSQPRHLSQEQVAALQDLAHCVVTELQTAEVIPLTQRLWEREAYLHTLLTTLVHGIVTIDDQGIIQSINPATERLFGYTESELRGQTIHRLMPELDQTAPDGDLHLCLAGDGANRIGSGREGVGQRKDGSRFPLELAVGESRVGGVRQLVGIITDCTARKAAEARIVQQNSALQELNRLKNNFLGMAAHDLRNPLAALQGMSELLLEVSLPDTVKQEFFASIRRLSQQMLTMVNDLLDVATIESGHFVLNRSPGRLDQLVQERVRLARFTAQAKAIILEPVAEEVIWAAFDAERLAQVVDNLLSNAIKFSPAGRRVWVEWVAEAGQVGFAVVDQGPGIPEEERERLFGPFQRLSNRPTGGERSTGLGLAITHKIVAAHGGTIRVESTPGAGSRFVVLLSRV
ncbi:MAG: PAS domain S-box protein [Magnetococcales bacterium]|nr:PAS domain S-box protein [Magnetococcales bacterium]